MILENLYFKTDICFEVENLNDLVLAFKNCRFEKEIVLNENYPKNFEFNGCGFENETLFDKTGDND
ncbi:MAG: hypothetical protein MR902_08945 [Campylobacter sp.]|nr:hypothetical protein [Campylobacter sp.]